MHRQGHKQAGDVTPWFSNELITGCTGFPWANALNLDRQMCRHGVHMREQCPRVISSPSPIKCVPNSTPFQKTTHATPSRYPTITTSPPLRPWNGATSKNPRGHHPSLDTHQWSLNSHRSSQHPSPFMTPVTRTSVVLYKQSLPLEHFLDPRRTPSSPINEHSNTRNRSQHEEINEIKARIGCSSRTFDILNSTDRL